MGNLPMVPPFLHTFWPHAHNAVQVEPIAPSTQARLATHRSRRLHPRAITGGSISLFVMDLRRLSLQQRPASSTLVRPLFFSDFSSVSLSGFNTGTTLIMIASDAFSKYTSATGAVLDKTTGLLRITPAQYANLQSLYFTTNGVGFSAARSAIHGLRR